MHQRQLAAEPQAKSTKPFHERFPSHYDTCACGYRKRTKSLTCMECRRKRPVIDQPADHSIRHIPLTQGMYAVVDVADYGRLVKWVWHAHWSPNTKSYYAVRTKHVNGVKIVISMHRFILSAPVNLKVDHHSHDTLDNRRSNLRCATNRQSQVNRRKQKNNKSGFIGVVYVKRNPPLSKPWMAQMSVTVDGVRKNKYLGYFATPEEAATAYDIEILWTSGEFAFLNFPDRREEYLNIIRVF